MLECCTVNATHVVFVSWTNKVQRLEWSGQMQTPEAPFEGVWSDVASMKDRRYRFSGAVLEKNWFVVGGSGLDTAEVYDVGADRWLILPRMNGGPRAGPGVVACDNRILVIGGYSNSAAKDTIEMFDPREGKWQFVDKIDWHSGVGAIGIVLCNKGVDGPGVCTQTVCQPPNTLFAEEANTRFLFESLDIVENDAFDQLEFEPMYTDSDGASYHSDY